MTRFDLKRFRVMDVAFQAALGSGGQGCVYAELRCLLVCLPAQRQVKKDARNEKLCLQMRKRYPFSFLGTMMMFLPSFSTGNIWALLLVAPTR